MSVILPPHSKTLSAKLILQLFFVQICPSFMILSALYGNVKLSHLRAWSRRAQSLRSNELGRNALAEGVLHLVPQDQTIQIYLAAGENRYRELTRMSYKQIKKKLQNELSDPVVSQRLNNFRRVRKAAKSLVDPMSR